MPNIFRCVSVRELTNHAVMMWGFRESPESVEVSLHGTPDVYTLPTKHNVRAAVTQFIVGASGGASPLANFCVAIGIMHIVCGENPFGAYHEIQCILSGNT